MGTAFQIIMFFVSTAYQISQARKMRREMDKRKGFAINKRGEAADIPIVYGKQKVGLIEANHSVNSNRTYAAPLATSTEFLSKVEINNTRSGSKNEYLTMNGAICQEGISEIVSVEVDEMLYNQDKKHTHIIHTHTDSLSATDPLGAANDMPEKNKFSGCASATALFKLNREDYNYQGIPNLSFFIKGRKVRPITPTGFSATRVYSNNPVYVLADYLTYEYGRNLNDSDIDIPSFYAAAQVCEQTVATNKVYAGAVNGQKKIEDYETFSQFPGSPTREGAQGAITDGNISEAILYRDLSTGNVYNATIVGTNDQGSVGYYTQTTLPTRNIKLYECNIIIDPAQKIRDNVEAILNTMPLAILHWNSEGKYKLSLNYPTSESALASYSAITFNEDNIIRDSIDLAWLPASDRYNQCTVSFLNEHENFKEDSITWPTTNSSAHLALLTEDNNQPMSTSLDLAGITDPYHALARAEQTVRQSRTFHTLSFLANKEALKVEPGDYIKVELPQSDINAYYRVNSTEVNEDLTVKIECHYIDINSFAWNVADDIIPTSIPGGSDFTLSPPTNVTFDKDSSSLLGFSSGTLSFDGSPDASVFTYLIQASNDGGTTWSDLGRVQDIGEDSTGTETYTFEATGLKNGSYVFGVRAISRTGTISRRAISPTYALEFTGVSKLAIIYGSTNNQDTNIQTYDSTVSDRPYYALLTYQGDTQPTLPIRSSDSISDATELTTVLAFTPRVSEQSKDLTIYARSESQPNTPSGGSYIFPPVDNFTPPTATDVTWYKVIPPGVSDIWVSNASVTGFQSNNITPVWSTPALYGAAGENAGIVVVYADNADGLNATQEYADQDYILYYEYIGERPTTQEIVDEGTSTWVRFVGSNGLTGASTNIVFQRNSSKPNPPADSPGVPANWYDDVPTGTDILWAVKGTKAVDSDNFVWGTVFQVQGEAVAEVAIYRKNSNSGASGGSYDFTTNTLTPPSNWSVDAPAVSSNGDVVYRASGLVTGSPDDTAATVTYGSPVIYARRQDGQDGDTGSSIIPIYANDASGSVQGLTPSSTLNYVNFYETTLTRSQVGALLPISGLTFIKFEGEDGAPGSPGAAGSAGLRTRTVRWYRYYASGTPSAPQYTYIYFDQGTIHNGGSWSYEAPTVEALNAGNYWFVDITYIDESGTTDLCFHDVISPVQRLFNFNGLVTFTNTSGTTDLNTALKDSSTVIDGGRITTGTISANRIDTDAINVTSAMIGTATVQTLNIAGQAVTFPEISQGVTSIDLNASNGETLLAFFVAPASGNYALVDANVSITHTQVNQTTTNEGQYAKCNIRLYRTYPGGSETFVKGTTSVLVGGLNLNFFSLPYKSYISPSAGTVFGLKVEVTGGDAGYLRVLYPTIKYLELKR